MKTWITELTTAGWTIFEAYLNGDHSKRKDIRLPTDRSFLVKNLRRRPPYRMTTLYKFGRFTIKYNYRKTEVSQTRATLVVNKDAGLGQT